MAINTIPGPTNRVAEFTTSGTWVCPSGVYSAEFLVVGAGGGGGGCTNSVITRSSAGGGGGGGAVKKVTLGVTPGASYTVTIGAKGTGGTIANPGNNGGYSEIVLSGNTLIRSFGGYGGAGVTALDFGISPTLTQTIAGMGGNASTAASAVVAGGGGGGAFPFAYVFTTSATQSYNNAGGTEGGYGGAVTTATQGRIGIDGYGAGGGGGAGTSATLSLASAAAPYGAGTGGTGTGVVAATLSPGNAALANTGSGGGGAYCGLSTTGAAGGNGSDGIVRIAYVA